MTTVADFSADHRKRIVDAAPAVGDEAVQQIRLRLAPAEHRPVSPTGPGRTDIELAA